LRPVLIANPKGLLAGLAIGTGKLTPSAVPASAELYWQIQLWRIRRWSNRLAQVRLSIRQ